MVSNVDSKIDNISKNLIDSCLTNMTMDNSRKWLNTYLPLSLEKIV
jgi:hypothetical protein